MPAPSHPSALSKLWRLCCSLKLAIVFASLLTLLLIYGSLAMHARPELFGDLDRLALHRWFARLPVSSFEHTWWLAVSGVLVGLLALNTLCCFIDWLGALGSRWRKIGEYSIHLGFVLLVVAFAWGSLMGTRNNGVQIPLGKPYPIPGMPGRSLIVDAVDPVLNEQGRPLDMRNRVRLIEGESLLAAEEISINRPLLFEELVVVPISFGRQADGFECFMPGRGRFLLTPGASHDLGGGKRLRVLEFLPDAARNAAGDLIPRSRQLQNPALRLELSIPGAPTWQGWYLLRDPLPYPLVAGGVRFWPVKPIFTEFTVLTLNLDPGAKLALSGGLCMLAGTLFALASFYRKRRANDRPVV